MTKFEKNWSQRCWVRLIRDEVKFNRILYIYIYNILYICYIYIYIIYIIYTGIYRPLFLTSDLCLVLTEIPQAPGFDIDDVIADGRNGDDRYMDDNVDSMSLDSDATCQSSQVSDANLTDDDRELMEPVSSEGEWTLNIYLNSANKYNLWSYQIVDFYERGLWITFVRGAGEPFNFHGKVD